MIADWLIESQTGKITFMLIDCQLTLLFFVIKFEWNEKRRKKNHLQIFWFVNLFSVVDLHKRKVRTTLEDLTRNVKRCIAQKIRNKCQLMHTHTVDGFQAKNFDFHQLKRVVTSIINWNHISVCCLLHTFCRCLE